MDPDVPLVVPEVNPHDIAKHRGIIANPNCSTIQMVVALKPLHDAVRVRRVVVSTYQSVSGAGQKGIHELEAQTEAHVKKARPPAPSKFAHPIFGNCIPQIDDFLPSGYTKEEMKMVNETRKIMGDATIDVSPTCVRVPVPMSHSESILVETERPITADEARSLWAGAPGVTVVDDPLALAYPLAAAAAGKDDVFVGRIRQDLHRPNTLLFWCVSDNLRKGAATNAVQIAELIDLPQMTFSLESLATCLNSETRGESGSCYPPSDRACGPSRGRHRLHTRRCATSSSPSPTTAPIFTAGSASPVCAPFRKISKTP